MAGWDTAPTVSVGLDLNEKEDKPVAEQKISRANAREKFQRFFSSFRSNAGSGDTFPYRRQIVASFEQNEFRVSINMEDLRSFDHDLSDALLHRPDDYLDSISDAAKAIIISLKATQKLVATEMPTIQAIVCLLHTFAPVSALVYRFSLSRALCRTRSDSDARSVILAFSADYKFTGN